VTKPPIAAAIHRLARNFQPDLLVWPTLSVAFTLCSAVVLLAMTVRDKVPAPVFQGHQGQWLLDLTRDLRIAFDQG